jgi:hypothetical protein
MTCKSNSSNNLTVTTNFRQKILLSVYSRFRTEKIQSQVSTTVLSGNYENAAYMLYTVRWSDKEAMAWMYVILFFTNYLKFVFIARDTYLAIRHNLQSFDYFCFLNVHYNVQFVQFSHYLLIRESTCPLFIINVIKPTCFLCMSLG